MLLLLTLALIAHEVLRTVVLLKHAVVTVVLVLRVVALAQSTSEVFFGDMFVQLGLVIEASDAERAFRMAFTSVNSSFTHVNVELSHCVDNLLGGESLLVLCAEGTLRKIMLSLIVTTQLINVLKRLLTPLALALPKRRDDIIEMSLGQEYTAFLKVGQISRGVARKLEVLERGVLGSTNNALHFLSTHRTSEITAKRTHAHQAYTACPLVITCPESH